MYSADKCDKELYLVTIECNRNMVYCKHVLQHTIINYFLR